MTLLLLPKSSFFASKLMCSITSDGIGRYIHWFHTIVLPVFRFKKYMSLDNFQMALVPLLQQFVLLVNCRAVHEFEHIHHIQVDSVSCNLCASQLQLLLD